MPRRRDIAAAVLLVAVAGAAAAEPEIRAADVARLENGRTTLGAAVLEALAAGPDADVRALVDALRGAPGPLDPTGEWRCRTIKIGGLVPLVAYSDFRCTVTVAEDGGWTLQKVTGSQRAVGTIHPPGDRAIYTGVGFVGDAPSEAYDEIAGDVNSIPHTTSQTVPVVGWFEQMSEDRARLMQPEPLLESAFDILYLTR